MARLKIAGIRQTEKLALITIAPFPISSYHLEYILSPLAINGINLEFIAAQGTSPDNMGLAIGLKEAHIAAALGIIKEKRKIWPKVEISYQEGVGMISIFPHGKRAAIISNFLSALQERGIKLLALNLSLSAISVIIEEKFIPQALNSLSDYFYLAG